MAARATDEKASAAAQAALSEALHDFFRAARRARGRAARQAPDDSSRSPSTTCSSRSLEAPLTNRELAELAGVSSPTATRMVDVLVGRDLVTRIEDPSDRRAVVISLTETGRMAVSEKTREYDKAPPPHRRSARAGRAGRGGRPAAAARGRDRGALSQPRPGYLLSHRATIAAFSGVLLGMLLAVLNQTIVATALPRIVADLGGLEHYSWVFSAYMLAATVTVPIYGRLSDIHGRRPFFVFGILIFMAGAVIGGTAGSMTQLIIARAVQGLGAGALIPLAMAVIGDLVPPSDRGRWQGLDGRRLRHRHPCSAR